MNKKGNMIDWFLIIGFLFLFATSIFISLYVINTVDESGVFADEPDAQNAINITKNTIIGFDNLFLFALIGLSLFVLISSAFVFNHPAFFIIGFLLLCIAVTLAAIMANAYDDLISTPQLESTAENFPKMNFVMGKLPLYIAFMFFATLTVMYVSYSRQE